MATAKESTKETKASDKPQDQAPAQGSGDTVNMTDAELAAIAGGSGGNLNNLYANGKPVVKP